MSKVIIGVLSALLIVSAILNVTGAKAKHELALSKESLAKKDAFIERLSVDLDWMREKNHERSQQHIGLHSTSREIRLALQHIKDITAVRDEEDIQMAGAAIGIVSTCLFLGGDNPRRLLETIEPLIPTLEKELMDLADDKEPTHPQQNGV